MKTAFYYFRPICGHNYSLYLENVLNGTKSHSRYFRTIKDALQYVNSYDFTLPTSVFWRLVRITDNKNFTNRIY